MWRYNSTYQPNNFIRKVNNNDNQCLYHSDVYLGKDYSKGIKHWKYIKKYKTPSGRWRYIYKSEVKNGVTRDTPDSPEEMERKGEKDEWISTGSYTTPMGNKRHTYISPDGSRISDVPDSQKKKIEYEASPMKKFIAKGKNFLYRLFK